ncbi:hypothetical protein ACFWGD_01225 [Corynebacterium sp. NPDC060344]|uniref:hypothetical protein n=1 Tax=Corynebacterium sp. NPDC060344 TaxID=3347101 RepID=UPI003655DE48
MQTSFPAKMTSARGLAASAAVALALGLAACGAGSDSESDTNTDTTTDTGTATDTATTTENQGTDAPATDTSAATESAAKEGDEGSSSSEPFAMTEGSTTVTIDPGQAIPLNEMMRVTWDSEGHSTCGTILTLMTPDNLMLRFDADAGCSGEFRESLDQSLGATAGTWTLMLAGTPDGDIEVPIEVG